VISTQEKQVTLAVLHATNLTAAAHKKVWAAQVAAHIVALVQVYHKHAAD
jgi:hypothetical protein